MTRDEAVTMIRANTAHDSDTQVTDAQLREWIKAAYYRLRRKIADVAPDLYSKATATQVLSSSSTDFSMPADFARLIRFERQEGQDFVALEVADELHPDLVASGRGYRAITSAGALLLRVYPTSAAPGTYRLVYVYLPDLTGGAGNYTFELPAGLEEIITEGVSARVRVRFNEDAAAHWTELDRLWTEQRTSVRRMYGNHGQSGFRWSRGGW
jgi:hypothetical protein